MSDHTQEKNHFNVNFVRRNSSKIVIRLSMNEYIQEKNHSNVNFATYLLQRHQTKLPMSISTPEKKDPKFQEIFVLKQEKVKQGKEKPFKCQFCDEKFEWKFQQILIKLF